MLEFELPWAFVLLAVPPLLLLLPAYREARDSVRVPFFARLVEVTGGQPTAGSSVIATSLLQRVLLVAAWMFLVTALARPQWVGRAFAEAGPGNDLVVAVDLSASMGEPVFVDVDGKRVARLDAVKSIVGAFAVRRGRDRVGLVVFGDQAFPEVPLTRDREVFATLLGGAQAGAAGTDAAIGDAIGVAVRMLRLGTAGRRVLVVLTGSNDAGSRLPLPRAAEIATAHGVVVHTIAVGDRSTVGDHALQAVSRTAGGRSFRATGAEELEVIFATLDDIEPELPRMLSHRPTRALFQWPLGAFVLVVLGQQLTMAVRSRRATTSHGPGGGGADA